MRPLSFLRLLLAVWALLCETQAVELPSMNELISKAIDRVLDKYEIKPGCSVEIKKDNCSISFISDPKGCVSPKDLAQKLLGDSSDIAAKISSFLPGNLDLESAEVDKCEKSFDMSVGVNANFEIIRGVVTLNDVHIWVKFLIQPPDLFFNVTGTWTLGSFKFAVSVFIVVDEIDFYGTHISTSVQSNIGSIVNSVGNSFVPAGVIQDAIRKVRFNGLNVHQVSLRSRFINRGHALRLSFTVRDSALGNPVVHLTLIKLTNSTSNTSKIGATIGSRFSNLKLSSLINRLTGIDISNVPLVGKVTFPSLCMIFSTLDLGEPLIPYNDQCLSKLVSINTGFQMVTEIQLQPGSPPVEVKITITTTKFEFKFLGDSGLSIKAFIDLLVSSLGNFQLPPKFDLGKFLNFKLTSFEYDSSTKIFTLPVILTEPIVFVPKALELENATIVFKIQKSPVKTAIEFKSTWELGSLSIPLNISKPLGLSVFCAEARPDMEIPFGTMIKQFLVGILPRGPLENAVKNAGFDGFYVKDPYFKIYLASDKVVRLSGTTVIGVWDKCKVEIVLGQVRGAFVMATGIVLENVPITKLIYKVTNKQIDLRNIPGASILDNTDVAISMASQNVPKAKQFMQFSIPALSDVEILDGVILLTSFKFPEDCKTDIGCKIFKRLLGRNAQLILKGRLYIASVYIAATVPTEIQLFKGVNITDVGLELEAGPTRNSLGIKGTLKLQNPPLTFIGSFGISTGGVFLQMSMAGLWRKPFNIPFLAVGDLHLRVAISPLPGFITVLEFGGRGMLGDLDNDNAQPINASMFFGIDRVSPLENFFYGSTTALTLRACLAAFGRSVSLPAAIADTGFPLGVNVSFALKSKVLPNGVTVVRGFFIQGMIKILSLEAFCDLKINLNGIYINMTVSPFNIGNGLIAISGRSAKSGPRIFVDIGWNPPRAFVNIEGSIEVLRIRSTTNVTISTEGISFEVSGSFLGLFEAGLKVSTQYSSIKTADFQVSGYFRQGLMQKLETEAKKALDNYKKSADEAIDKAKKKVNDAKKAFDAAADKVASFRSKVRNQKAKCDAAINYLGSKKRFFDSKKKIFDDASRKVANARNNLNRKQKAYNDAVKKTADKLKKGCPSECRNKRAVENIEDALIDETKAKQFIEKRGGRVKRGWVRLPRVRIRVKNPVEIGREVAEKAREKVEDGREKVEDGREILKERGREAVENTREFAKERAREAKCLAQKTARKLCLGVISGLQAVVKTALKSLDAAKLVLKGAEQLVKSSKVVMDVAKGALTLAQNALRGCNVLLDGANLALKGAEILVRNTKHTLTVVNAGLEAVKRVNRLGVEIAKKIVSLGLGGLLDIQELKFDIKLSVAQTGHFSGSMTARILGVKKTFSFYIKIRSIKDMVKAIVDKVKAALGLRRKRSIDEDSFRLLGRVTRDNRLQDEIDSCHSHRVIYGLAVLLVNDTEGLPEVIKQLEGTLKYYDNKNTDEVTKNDLEDLSKMAVDDLLRGVDVVLDLYRVRLGLSRDQVLQLLSDTSKFSQDSCLRTVSSRLAKIFVHPEVDISDTEDHLIQLEQEIKCVSTEKCGGMDDISKLSTFFDG